MEYTLNLYDQVYEKKPEAFWHRFVVSRQCYTGETSHLFFDGGRKIGIAVQTTESPEVPLEIKGRNTRLTRSDAYAQSGEILSRKLLKVNGDVAAEIYPEQYGKTYFRMGQRIFTAERSDKHFRFYDQEECVAKISPAERQKSSWTEEERALYWNLLENYEPVYVMKIKCRLSELELLVMLSFPVLYCPGHTGYPEHGRNQNIRDVVRYLDHKGNQVSEESAEFVVFDRWEGNRCISSEQYQLVADCEVSEQANIGQSADPVIMQVMNKQVCMDEVEAALRAANTDDIDEMLDVAGMLYGRVGIISMDTAIEMLRIRMEMGAFPRNYDRDTLPSYKEELRNRLETEGSVYCSVKGTRMDFTEVRKRILLKDHFGSRPGTHMSFSMKKEMGVSDDEEAFRLFRVILLTGKVPGSFGARILRVDNRVENAEDTYEDPDKTIDLTEADLTRKAPDVTLDLDIHGVLELEYYPSSGERNYTVVADGIPVQVELKRIASNNEEIVVKGAGRLDPESGMEGDAYIRIKYAHCRYRFDSLGNLLKNAGMYFVYILVMAVYLPVSLVKAVFRFVLSKAGLIMGLLIAAAFAVWYFLFR